eukprot:2912926-Rhodomonas_salina.1
MPEDSMMGGRITPIEQKSDSSRFLSLEFDPGIAAEVKSCTSMRCGPSSAMLNVVSPESGAHASRSRSYAGMSSNRCQQPLLDPSISCKSRSMGSWIHAVKRNNDSGKEKNICNTAPCGQKRRRSIFSCCSRSMTWVAFTFPCSASSLFSMSRINLPSL